MRHQRGKHQTLDKDLRQPVDWLESLPEVSRIIAGKIEPCRHSYTPGVLRCRRTDGKKLFLNGYIGGGVREIIALLHSEDQVGPVVNAITKRYDTDFKSVSGPSIDRKEEKKRTK